MQIENLMRQGIEPRIPDIQIKFLFLHGEDKRNLFINILNSKYIQINQKLYEIIGMPNLSKIYDIAILSQAEGTLDRFYYDLIENK